jgi:NAD(P)-dependent dehydrogenase (short-subunit alcohol dehydrogenase family)
LTVIVTGADGGIGEEVCKELAKRKAIICMASKVVENGEKVKKKILRHFPNAKITVKQLDLRSFDNVRKFAESVGKFYFTFISKWIFLHHFKHLLTFEII